MTKRVWVKLQDWPGGRTECEGQGEASPPSSEHSEVRTGSTRSRGTVLAVEQLEGSNANHER